MATTNDFPASDINSYDYIIVGGGTAGCVIASRLAQYLPNKRILVIEGGPSDFNDDRVLNLREWLNLLGGELDYDYPTTEQPMGIFTWEVIVDTLVYGVWMAALCLSSFSLVMYGWGDGDLGSGCNTSYHGSAHYDGNCETVFRARATTFVCMTWFALFLA
ncbi:hypothetical protein BDV36DRAFT_301430, partial [Aspergillus pseudocaelatus]